MTAEGFDGCARRCRKEGKHCFAYGVCEFADRPEPRVSIGPKAVQMEDGYNSLVYSTFTLAELTQKLDAIISAALGSGYRYVAEAVAKWLADPDQESPVVMAPPMREMTDEERAVFMAEYATTGVRTPGCDCGHDGMGPSWHATDCTWRNA
jgi:hypothetical protein